jgi:transcriptional regulator with XRE-family HTH domain
MATTLAERLQTALSKKDGATQADLARACHVSRSSVTDWLNGDIKELKADSLVRAARFLEVRPEWLLWGEAPMRAETLKADEKELLALWRKMDDKQKVATMGVASLGRMISHPIEPNIPPAPDLPGRATRLR